MHRSRRPLTGSAALAPAARALAALALAAVLGACSTGSGSGAGQAISGQPSPGGPSGSSTTSSTTSAAPSSSTTSSARSTHTTIAPPSAPLRTARVTSGADVYAVDVWAQKSDPDCVTHAHGTAVVNFLRAHPCRGLSRQLGTTTVNGRPVGFSAESLSFAGSAPSVYTVAGSFRRLVLAPDTGSVNDLMADGYRLPAGPSAIPSAEAFVALAQDAAVTVYDAWYLSGSTPDNDPALVKMLQAIYLQY